MANLILADLAITYNLHFNDFLERTMFRKNALRILFVFMFVCLVPASFAQAYKYTPDLPDGSPWKDYKWQQSFNQVDKYVSSGVIVNTETGYAYELIQTTAMHVPALLEHAATRTWDYQGQTLQGQLATANTKETYDWIVGMFNNKAKNAQSYDQRWDMSRSDIKGDTAFAASQTWYLYEILIGGYRDLATNTKQWESGAAWGFEAPGAWGGNFQEMFDNGNPTRNWLMFMNGSQWGWADESCLTGYLIEYKLPSATPIPAALPLLGTGLAGLIALKRRNKA